MLPGRSEWQDHVEHLLAVTRLLDIGNLAPASVGDAGFGYPVIGDRVFPGDILRPDDTTDLQVAEFEVHADFLTALDDQITVRQYVPHQRRDPQGDLFVPAHRAFPVRVRIRTQVDGRIDARASVRQD